MRSFYILPCTQNRIEIGKRICDAYATTISCVRWYIICQEKRKKSKWKNWKRFFQQFDKHAESSQQNNYFRVAHLRASFVRKWSISHCFCSKWIKTATKSKTKSIWKFMRKQIQIKMLPTIKCNDQFRCK